MINLLLSTCGVAAAIPLLWFVLSRLGIVRATLNATGAMLASVLTALSVLWLMFASTYLFWLLPVALLACGYFGHILGGIIREKLITSQWLVLAAVGIGGIVGVFHFGPDAAFGYFPAALLIANTVLFLGFAAVYLLRPKISGRQRFTYTVLLVLASPLIFAVYQLGMHTGVLVPSGIVDFRPTKFSAVANGRFFYSVGDDLKYSDQIESKAPTILQGRIKNFLVSPDSKRMAVVVGGQMRIINGETGEVREVLPVRSSYENPIPTGVSFFRDNHFQWSRDSKTLYLIKDEYYKSGKTGLHDAAFSEKGELWKYEVETGTLQLVFKPFRSTNYFFGENSGVYFSVPNAEGNLQLMKLDGTLTREVDKPNARDISDNTIQPDRREAVFYSFSTWDYEKDILPSKGVSVISKKGQPQELVIGGRSVLRVKGGDLRRLKYAAFLPGDKFFLFDVQSRNHIGQLLIDTATGEYMTLKDVRVYVTANTNTFLDFEISAWGIQPLRKPTEQVVRH